MLSAERREACKIEALTATMFSDDLMDRGTPVLRHVVLPVSLIVVTHVKIDFRSGTGSLGATLERFRKVRWIAIIDSRFEKQETHVPLYSNS